MFTPYPCHRYRLADGEIQSRVIQSAEEESEGWQAGYAFPGFNVPLTPQAQAPQEPAPAQDPAAESVQEPAAEDPQAAKKAEQAAKKAEAAAARKAAKEAAKDGE